MSSDSSDDEFSYTNTASLLKKMVQKRATQKSEETDILLVDDTKGNKRKSDIIEIDCEIEPEPKRNKPVRKVSNKNVDKKVEEVICVDSSDVEVIEDNLDESSHIISQIEACLKRNNSRRGKGRRKVNKKSPAKKKRGKKKAVVIDTIEIDPDYPILNSVNEHHSDDVNYEINLKVLWKSQTCHRFEVRRFQKLDVIFKHFAEQENISDDRLLFMLKDKVVSKADTPYSIGVTAASIIEGGILSEKSYLSSAVSYSRDTIELKVQLKDSKKPLMVNIRVTDPLKILMSQCSENINVPVEKLKFYFDGDIIQATDSPMDLQLEGGECIDCVEIK